MTVSREYIERLRLENAAAREREETNAVSAVVAARNEFAQSIGKARGLVKDDTPASLLRY